MGHLGLSGEAEKIEAAVLAAVREKRTTVDVGGPLGTREAGPAAAVTWQAARSGLPADTAAVNHAAQVNQFLAAHGITVVYGDVGGVFKQGTVDEVAIQEDINTRKGVERIIRYAFEYCERHKKQDGSPRRKVLMCDKSNAMTHAGGLWQRVFHEVSREYPQITAEHMYVDALCMQMVRDPRQFDVIVTNNMFGDIITDLAAGLQGGLGMAASGNIHPGKTSMFEPVHGSAPTIAGKNMANPFGAILTAAMMLGHLGLSGEAEKIEAAVLAAVREKRTTVDVGGPLGTREAGEWVNKKLAS